MSESLAVAGSVIEVVLPPDNVYAKAQADAAAASAASANLHFLAAVALMAGKVAASQGAGEAITTTGQYFAVIPGTGALDVFVRTSGSSTRVGAVPMLNLVSGYLGIGTAVPAQPVHISQADQALARLRLENTGSGGHAFDIIAGIHGASQEGLSIHDVTAAAIRMVMTNAGNVSFAASAPTAIFGKTVQISGGSENGTLAIVGSSGAGYVATFSTSLLVSGRAGMALGLGADDATKITITTAGNVIPAADNTQDLGSGSFRFDTIFAGTGTINTSDARAKTDIGEIPDEWLDAWGEVEWVRYKFFDGSRWHVGLVAQQVHAAFAAHEIDAFEIGLCCFDEWDASDAVDEVRDEDGEIIVAARPALEAGDRWGLRYSECEAMEVAYQRRRIAQLEAQVAAMEAAP